MESPDMFPGQYTLCLKTKDLAGMRRFYEALGMKMHFEQPNAVLLNNGDIDLALMTFLNETCLNFRGADISTVYKNATATGLEFESEPEAYKKEKNDAEADGENWMLHDPDGNNIFFDTNEGASEAWQRSFRSKVLDRFMPSTRRAKTTFNLDTSPLTESGMFAGHFGYCLKTTDNKASVEFYEALGLPVVGNNDDSWASIGTSDCHLDLMTFLGENWLNFRGADVFKLFERMKTSGFKLEGEPERYSGEEFNSPPGAHWTTRDPDGNVVYFDTTDPELIVNGAHEALERVLRNTLNRLTDIGADEACIAVFKTEMIERYLG